MSQKRDRQSRITQEHIVGVGMVNVLKLNQYSLTQGEPSVYERESTAVVKTKEKRVKFENEDFCLKCWDGGTLYCCNLCPASYHKACLSETEANSLCGFIAHCPHHLRCVSCERKSGFTFRCEVCPQTFCEDCVPAEYEYTGYCNRWSKLGYKQPGSSCMIICSKDCKDFVTRTLNKK